MPFSCTWATTLFGKDDSCMVYYPTRFYTLFLDYLWPTNTKKSQNYRSLVQKMNTMIVPMIRIHSFYG